MSGSTSGYGGTGSGTSGLAGTPAPVTINFVQIPSTEQVPGTYLEISADEQNVGIFQYPAKVLMLAPVLPTVAATYWEPVQVFTPQQGAALLGQNGIGAQMVAAFLAVNQTQPLWVVPVPPPTGATAPSWAIDTTVTTALTGAPGTLPLYIGDQQAAITVTPGVDTSGTIAANLAAAVNALNLSGVTAAVNAGTTGIVVTALDPGTLANGLPVEFCQDPGDMIPGGQTAGVNNLTTTITPTAGTLTPTLSTAIANVAATWFTHWITPWVDAPNVALLEAEFTRRFGAMVALGARCFGFVSAGSLTALLAATNGDNSRFMSIGGLQNEPSAPWKVAATYGAVSVKSLVQNPALQLGTLALPGIKAPAAADVLDQQEQQTMLTADGRLATFVVGADGTVRIGRAVTTYWENEAGVPDATWMDITTAETADRIRFDWAAYRATVYPRNEMTADGTVAAEYNPNIVTPRLMSGAWAARSLVYEKAGWIQNSAATAQQAVFQLDPNNPNRMDAQMPYQQAGNLMILAGQLIVSLNGQ